MAPFLVALEDLLEDQGKFRGRGKLRDALTVTLEHEEALGG